jgi:hypothetical protein
MAEGVIEIAVDACTEVVCGVEGTKICIQVTSQTLIATSTCCTTVLASWTDRAAAIVVVSIDTGAERGWGGSKP